MRDLRIDTKDISRRISLYVALNFANFVMAGSRIVSIRSNLAVLQQPPLSNFCSELTLLSEPWRQPLISHILLKLETP